MVLPGSHVGFPISAKNKNLVYDHPINISAKFDSNLFCGKLCVFYVDRNSKMTTTAGHSFYIGPIVFFYYQVNDTGS
jgi:ABC-type polysaccharide/polyol phosphate export permease